MWKIWAPMLVTPVIALGGQSIVYALATPLCERQAGPWVHAVFLLLLAGAAWLVACAWGEARRLDAAHVSSAGQALPPDTDRHGPNRLFLARVAAGTAAIATLALLAMWVPSWLLSPCTG